MSRLTAGVRHSWHADVEVREGVGVGGGRGVFAVRDIEPGALLMHEVPFARLPEGISSQGASHHEAMVAGILRCEPEARRAEQILAAAQLHPTSLGQLSPHVLQQLREVYAPALDRLCSNNNGPPGCGSSCGNGGGDGHLTNGSAPCGGASPDRPARPHPSCNDSSGACSGGATYGGANKGGANNGGANNGGANGGVGDDSRRSGGGGGYNCSALPPLCRCDVLRLLAASRFNAFRSGFYQQQAMINHACRPNAIKLATRGGGCNVHAMQRIKAGEEVTISYLVPPYQSKARRSATLQQQHFFTPSGPAFPLEAEAFLTPPTGAAAAAAPVLPAPPPAPYTGAGSLGQGPAAAAAAANGQPACNRRPGGNQPLNTCPASHDGSVQQQQQLCAIEDRLDEVDDVTQELEEQEAASRANGGGGDSAALIARSVSMAASLLRCVDDAAALVAPRHVALLRAHTAVVRATQLLLSYDLDDKDLQPLEWHLDADNMPIAATGVSSGSSGGNGGDAQPPVAAAASQPQPMPRPPPKGPPHVRLAILLLKSALEVRDTQALLEMGAEHYDVARNTLDTQQALSFLLGAGSRQLLAAFPHRWPTFGRAAAEDAGLAREYQRVSALYKKS